MLVLLTKIINASKSQDWYHCCNGVLSVFVIKYNTSFISIIYWYVSFETPCIYFLTNLAKKYHEQIC